MWPAIRLDSHSLSRKVKSRMYGPH
jgi:hypothetical protein